jgi:hypothetical protein
MTKKEAIMKINMEQRKKIRNSIETGTKYEELINELLHTIGEMELEEKMTHEICMEQSYEIDYLKKEIRKLKAKALCDCGNELGGECSTCRNDR